MTYNLLPGVTNCSQDVLSRVNDTSFSESCETCRQFGLAQGKDSSLDREEVAFIFSLFIDLKHFLMKEDRTSGHTEKILDHMIQKTEKFKPRTRLKPLHQRFCHSGKVWRNTIIKRRKLIHALMSDGQSDIATGQNQIFFSQTS